MHPSKPDFSADVERVDQRAVDGASGYDRKSLQVERNRLHLGRARQSGRSFSPTRIRQVSLTQ